MPEQPRPGESPARRTTWYRRRRRLRVAAWRARHLLAGLALAGAGQAAVAEVAPPPPALEDVVVLVRRMPAGAVLREADLRAETSETAPDGALAQVGSAVGRRLAVALPAGLPLVPEVFAGAGVAAGAPPGTVVVPVRLADPDVARLLGPGDVVDLHRSADDGGPARVVASGAIVLAGALPAPEAALGADGSAAPLVFIAVSPAVATLVTGASGWSALSVVLVSGGGARAG